MFADNPAVSISKDLPPLPKADEQLAGTSSQFRNTSLDQVRNEVAASVALRAVQSCREVDGVKVGQEGAELGALRETGRWRVRAVGRLGKRSDRGGVLRHA